MSSYSNYLDKKIKSLSEVYVGAERLPTHTVHTEIRADNADIYKNPITEKEIEQIISEDKKRSNFANELFDEARYWPGIRIGVVSSKEIYFWPSIFQIEDVEKALNKKFIMNLAYESDTKIIYDDDVENKRGTFTEDKKKLISDMDANIGTKIEKVPQTGIEYIDKQKDKYKQTPVGLMSVFPLGTKFANYMHIPVSIEKEKEIAMIQHQEYNWYIDKKLSLFETLGENWRKQ
ncbi:MAG: hypothetical protein QXG00_07205 [Candidatus Woesearchaeota archaeon]